MFEPGVGEELSIALVNAVLMALWVVLPGLLFGYIRQSLVARRLRPEFSLRKSEAIELDRAVVLYEKVRHRLAEIDQGDGLSVWRVLFECRADICQAHADELEDLKAHAHHLRTTIIRLKRRPFQRLRTWVHIKSSQFALSCALAAHLIGLALLIVAFYFPDRPVWGMGLTLGGRSQLAWYPFDPHVFYANAVASGFAALAAPFFYLVRWAGLHHEFTLEYCVLQEFAETMPGQPSDQPCGDAAQDASQQVDLSENDGNTNWFAVLQVSPSARIEEVEKSYKVLIKQNHPDRVHGMSPAIRKLAEMETKKLNIAYQQAVNSVSSTATN